MGGETRRMHRDCTVRQHTAKRIGSFAWRITRVTSHCTVHTALLNGRIHRRANITARATKPLPDVSVLSLRARVVCTALHCIAEDWFVCEATSQWCGAGHAAACTRRTSGAREEITKGQRVWKTRDTHSGHSPMRHGREEEVRNSSQWNGTRTKAETNEIRVFLAALEMMLKVTTSDTTDRHTSVLCHSEEFDSLSLWTYVSSLVRNSDALLGRPSGARYDLAARFSANF
jgi:hypothetical protein